MPSTQISGDDARRRNNTDLACKLVFFALLVYLSLLAINELRTLIFCLIFAVTLASSMTPLAESCEKKRIPRIATVLAIYACAALVYVMVGASLVPAIKEQGAKLSESLPAYLAKVDQTFEIAKSMAGDAAQSLTFKAEDLKGIGSKLLQRTVNVGAGAFGMLANAILVLFLSAYFVVEADSLWSGLLPWLRPTARERFKPLIVPLAQRMGGYVRGQLLVSLGAAVVLTAGFALLGVHYALLLGVLAGILNLVPYVGSMIAVGCALVIAFNQSPFLIIGVLVLYAAEQWLESTVMVPLFLGKNVSLHPLVVLLTIIIGGSLFGLAGALVSVPVTAAGLFLAEEFYLKVGNQLESEDRAT